MDAFNKIDLLNREFWQEYTITHIWWCNRWLYEFVQMVVLTFYFLEPLSQIENMASNRINCYQSYTKILRFNFFLILKLIDFEDEFRRMVARNEYVCLIHLQIKQNFQWERSVNVLKCWAVHSTKNFDNIFLKCRIKGIYLQFVWKSI